MSRRYVLETELKNELNQNSMISKIPYILFFENHEIAV